MKEACITMCVVKRKGHIQHYEERKVYASVYAAGLNCHYGEQKAEKIAKQVAKKITNWIKGKKKVSSLDVRKQVIKALNDKDVKLMYESHLDLS